MATCNASTLESSGKDFQRLSKRELQIVTAQLLCNISAGGAGTGGTTVTVSPSGIANGQSTITNNGAQYGPDTSGTTTSGIQEALNALHYATSLGPQPGSGRIIFGPGVFEFSGQIVINDAYPLDLVWQGCGKVGTILKYTGTSNAIVDAGHANLPAPRLQFTCRDMGFAYLQDTTKAYLMKLTDVNECRFERCLWTTWGCLTTTPYSTLNYIQTVPTNAVGVVGLRLGQGADNQHVYEGCTFYGLATGLWDYGDHVRVHNTMFANCGFTSAGGGTYTNQYAPAVGQQENNVLSLGAAFVGTQSAFDDTFFLRCHFHFCNAAAAIYNGGSLWLKDCLYEGTRYCTLTDGDNYSILVDDYTGNTLCPNGDHLYDPNTGVIGAVSGIVTHWQKDVWSFGSLLDINVAGSSKFNISSGGVVTIPNLTATRPVLTGSGGTLVSGSVPLTVYAAGTAYTLTATPALLDFGTTDPSLSITTAGTWLIMGTVGLKYNGSTYGSAQTITLKFRRTNNTAADLTNGGRTVELPVLTTFTGGDAITIPAVIYTTSNNNDTIQIFGSVSALPSAGSVTADSAEIVCVRLY